MTTMDARAETPAGPADWTSALCRPGALAPGLAPFGGADEVETVAQTHLSVVLLTPTHAVKIKKAAKFWGLVDQSTRARRDAACHDEIRLNRRLAPDLYLGVAAITQREVDGEMVYTLGGEAAPDAVVVESAVIMNRLPIGATLAERLVAGEACDTLVRNVATLLAAFHDRVRLTPGTADLAAQFIEILEGNFSGTPLEDNPVLPRDLHAAVRTRLMRGARTCAPLITARADAGLGVDGHGDVRLDHVAQVEGEVLIMDCVEFSERLRQLDPLSDAAFLAMDLRAKGHPDLARAFTAAYLAASETDAASTRPLRAVFEAYRAYVRATVDYHTAQDPGIAPAERTRKAHAGIRYLVQAWATLCTEETPPVILLRGKSGSGKSVVASALAPVLGAEIIRSDVIRKALAGLAPTDRVDGAAKDALYGPEMGARTYAALWEHAERALNEGRPALLDATWLRADARARIREQAGTRDAPVVIVDVTCDREEVRRRLKARAAANQDASDADWTIFEMQERDEDPLSAEEARLTVAYDSPGPIAPMLAALAERVERLR